MGHNPHAAAMPSRGKGAPGTARLVSGPISIGIDPGLGGALGFIAHDLPESPWVVDMPVIAHGQGFVKRAVNLVALAESLRLLTVIGAGTLKGGVGIRYCVTKGKTYRRYPPGRDRKEWRRMHRENPQPRAE